MNCQRVRELLPRYVDGDLARPDLERVAEHLAGCERCRRRLALHRDLPAALAGWPAAAGEAAASARLRGRVMEAVRRRERPPTLWQRAERVGNAVGWVGVSALAAVLVVAVALSWGAIADRRPRPVAATATAEATAAPTQTGSPTPTQTRSPTATQTRSPTAAPTRSPTPTARPTTPLASPTGAALALQRYTSPSLGFAVDYPATWQISTQGAGADYQGRPLLGSAGFTSDTYAAGEQALGRYTIGVTVRDAGGKTVAEAVEGYLSPIWETVRSQIKQRALTLAGEPAIELDVLPGRPSGRGIWAVHEGRLYEIRFSPRLPYETDTLVVAAYEAFLRSFIFVPVTETPVPPRVPTPAPTPPPGPDR